MASSSNGGRAAFDSNSNHVRNESLYSMDSFIKDFPRDGEDEEDTTNRSEEEPRLYFSPSSASASGPDVLNAGPHPMLVPVPVHIPMEPAAMQTIHSIPSRKNSSDGGSDSVPPILPEHPFFSASYYEDADNSDGSVVFNGPTPKVGKSIAARRDRNARDRFPSFDSVGSSGSIRYVSKQQIPPQQPMISAQSIPANINPQMLPYHERRKLMQQRQQQKQTPTPTPPRADAAASNRPMPPYMMPPPHPSDMPYFQPGPMSQHPYPPGGMPMHPPPGAYPYHPSQGMPPQGMMPPQGIFPPGMHPPGMPMNMYRAPPGVPMGQFPPYPGPPPHGYPQPQPHGPQSQSHGPRLSPFPSVGKTTEPVHVHRPPNSKASPRSRGHQQPQPLHPSSSLPPSGIQRPMAMNSNQGGTGMHSSSFDSSTSLERDGGSSAPHRRKEAPPPPPPPPPPLPPNYAHVRSDSNGSVSSLGSMLQTEGEDDKASKREGKEGIASESFFQRLNPWSPKQHNVKDFHQRNQAFLKRAERQQYGGQPPPVSPRTQQR